MPMSNDLLEYFGSFITDQRKELFESIIRQRTFYITVVLEDIFQPHNASAVLRTCDCFGIQNVHIIENRNKYQINPDVTLGSDKWLNLIRYTSEKNNSLDAVKALRERGYRIIATTPHDHSVSLNNFDLSKGKFALFFGTELNGLSGDILKNADENLQIPIYGFTESFNISVSAAIILHSLSEKLRVSDLPWQLAEPEKNMIMLDWLKKSVKNSELIEKEFYKKSIQGDKLA
jgi:tRNA (guanosine-2'-O-)-methyltransferase